MTDIWLISAPGESTPKETWEKLNKATTAESLSKNCKFHIPDLKVSAQHFAAQHYSVQCFDAHGCSVHHYCAQLVTGQYYCI